MKYVIWKAYWDYEKEERWLNEMSAQGMSFTDYSWCRYVFTDAPNGQYNYRIELLEYMPKHPESMAYLRFLEENGVEVVATYLRWVYLRKPASEGAFDLYTDLDSKIKHYQRINFFWTAMMIAEFAAAVSNLGIGIANLFLNERLGNFSSGNLIIGSVTLALGILFLALDLPIRQKIKKLRQEKAIHE
ncbi:MAG: DUF2812 domain-containing protein [Eubacteriales bacterium]|nr:DUF2812 domain-containing protein [Eubacteriales bacterium]